MTKEVEVVDIGCGFGGLMVGLAPLLPDTLMVGKYSAVIFNTIHICTRPNEEQHTTNNKTTGMEIRTSVLEYLSSRIHALRSQQQRLKLSLIHI